MKLIGRLTALSIFVISLVIPAGASAEFGFSRFDVRFEDQIGRSELQAGAHPFQMTTTFELENEELEPGVLLVEQAKQTDFEQIAGLIGNTEAVPRCSGRAFTEVPDPLHLFFTKCPADSAVGYVALAIDTRLTPESTPESVQDMLYAPVFFLDPAPGWPAALGFSAAGLRVIVNVGVKPGADYSIVASSDDIPQAKNFIGAKLTLWGVPADPRHDRLRGTDCLAEAGQLSCPTNADETAFLTLPRSCEGPLSTNYSLISWARPDDPPVQGSVTTPGSGLEPQGFVGCDRLGFAPTSDGAPNNVEASSPTGFNFRVDVEDEGLLAPEGLAQSDIESVDVKLPDGLVTNPSVANGLDSCSEEDLSRETPSSAPGAGCPESSKIGTVSVETPLLDQSVAGSLYVATPYENPFDSLLAVYLVIKDSGLGLLIKQPVKIVADPATGQLSARAEDLPQLPFSSFQVKFRNGMLAPLTTPQSCGTYQVQATLSPRAGGEPVSSTSPFSISHGANGGLCPVGGVPSFAPSFEAGTVAPLAGKYSPFVLKVGRDPGEAKITLLAALLPEGLLAKLAGVAECPETQIAQAVRRSGANEGAIEKSAPSCPTNSEVGTVIVGAGSGTQTYVQGKAYLAGPYKGAPLSLVVVTPAISGPFDLGTVVVRNALHVDPITAQVRAASDPLPTILQGVPLDIRTIAVSLDKPDFTINPTSCEPAQVAGSAGSALLQATSFTSRFQVGGCGGLGFTPTLSLRLKGKTKRAGNPALIATLRQPANQANIDRATVVLPQSEFIDNRHISNPCTRPQFNEKACPQSSILGKVRAYSPLLDAPLTGNVYFRSNGGDRELPDLVAALRGRIDVDLVGFIDSVKPKGSDNSRVRTRFATVPDAPVSKFELEMFGGKKGLLQNSVNLCKAPQRADTKFIAQNGKLLQKRLEIKLQCGAGKS
jgi:hypothetical protein